ncbi:MAG: polymer-forming cytoskeletal protein [Bacteroidales bacterium]|nr:polymer-forming cytoskeletal protein [Bacteroidales bacterium]
MSKKEPLPNPNSVNMIASSTEFVGDLITDSDIKFDGKLTGKLITKSKLVLGESGEINGEVHCKSAVVSGKITGKIFVEDIIMLQSSSHIEGDVSTSKIAIEPGAILNGTCKMGKNNNQPEIQPTVES